MNHPLEKLKSCTEISHLRTTLRSICDPYGSISQLDILSAFQAGKHQALCFLRMNSEEEENHLMAALGVGRFAGNLVVVVDMPNTSTRSSMAAA